MVSPRDCRAQQDPKTPIDWKPLRLVRARRNGVVRFIWSRRTGLQCAGQLFLFTLLMPTFVSAADKFNIKTGLWETTITPEHGDGLPIAPETLSHLSGKQRADVESQIKESTAQKLKPRTIKRCVTEKTYAQGKLLEQRRTDEMCTKNVAIASTTQLEIHTECTGPRKVTMTFHLESHDPETMNGTAHLTIADQSRSPIVSDSTLVSRWLGTDCGAIKPPAGE